MSDALGLHILSGDLYNGLSLSGCTIWRLMIGALVGSLHFVMRDFFGLEPVQRDRFMAVLSLSKRKLCDIPHHKKRHRMPFDGVNGMFLAWSARQRWALSEKAHRSPIRTKVFHHTSQAI